MNTDRLYLKYFDVDIDEETGRTRAVASLSVITDSLPLVEWIPVVFITNRTFQKMSAARLPELAGRIIQKMNNIHPVDRLPIGEIQLDCDWSNSTRALFFSLIELIKKQSGWQISATIRLHQIKYFERSGVPPVDRGVLMFYNTGDIGNWETENSILDLATAKKYLYNFDRYPLPLDLALPVFQWGLVFRNGRLVKILHQLEEERLTENNGFKKIANSRFEVQQDQYLESIYLYAGDLIRLEKSTPEDHEETLRLIRPHWQTTDSRIIFYHLNEKMANEYSFDLFQSLVN